MILDIGLIIFFCNNCRRVSNVLLDEYYCKDNLNHTIWVGQIACSFIAKTEVNNGRNVNGDIS